MKKTKMFFTAILLVASTWLVKSQTSCTVSPCTGTVPACEYVCNGGFDINNGPPTKFTDPGVGAFQQITHACGWLNSFSGYSPDYYLSSAASSSSVQIPCNINGTQSYQFDDGYAGLLGQTTWKEAIETPS